MKVKGISAKPEEAFKYWNSKKPVTRAEFDQLSDSARERAFVVSGLSRLDQVSSIHSAIEKAIDNGETLQSFKKRIAGTLDSAGWGGETAHRIENIYRTNMQTAYMAGRYGSLKKAAKTRPYWMYDAVGDRQTRPSHAVLDGKVYPADHPFWEKFYPPNGFFCRCDVISLSPRQVKARGLSVETDMPSQLIYKDPKTGFEIPVMPIPDKGFSGNVGKNWLHGLSANEVKDELKPIRLATPPNLPPLNKLDKRHMLPCSQKDILPKGLSDDEYLKAFLGEFGIADLYGSKAIKLPNVNLPIAIDRGLFTVDKATGHGLKVQSRGREKFLKLLARTIQNPYEIWLVPVEVSGKTYQSLRCLRLFCGEDGKVGGYGAFSLVNGRKWQGATVFTPKAGKHENQMLKYMEKQRQGILLYREELPKE
ncbi:MAG: phage minor head protein [Desulfovibrio sp.]